MTSYRSLKTLTLALVLAVGATPASAQRDLTADSILTVARLGADSNTIVGRGIVQLLFIYPQEFRPGVREAVVEGLESFVYEGVGTPYFRRSVVDALSEAGARFSDDPLPGMADRLARMYEWTEDEALRLHILEALGRSSEEGLAADFLSHVASGKGDPAVKAVLVLQRLGAPGRSALAQLHANGAVSNPQAQLALNKAAQRGFRPLRTNSRH